MNKETRNKLIKKYTYYESNEERTSKVRKIKRLPKRYSRKKKKEIRKLIINHTLSWLLQLIRNEELARKVFAVDEVDFKFRYKLR